MAYDHYLHLDIGFDRDGFAAAVADIWTLLRRAELRLCDSPSDAPRFRSSTTTSSGSTASITVAPATQTARTIIASGAAIPASTHSTMTVERPQ